MNTQLIAVIVAAVVLFAVAVVGALVFTGGNSDAGSVHKMPNGQMMTDSMENDSMETGSMMGHTMTNGQMGPMHTMSGDMQMPGMTHSSP